jgi:DNA-binding MarR family transcriptional regulator
MARDGRSDVREDARVPPLRGPEMRDPSARRPSVPMDRLTLPRGQERQPVRVRGRVYRLRESEARILATVGTFRVVRADDLQTMRSSRDAWTGDLRSLADQGLVQTRTVEVNRESTAVVVLTRAGRDVLEAHRSPGEGRAQTFHAGLVKPREIAHDSQLYRLYQAEAERIEAEGGRVSRVVLDYELKRDYQTFLNRPDRPEGANRADDIEAFAAVSGLPVIDDHLELPDLRIEFETADGRLESRDVELVTEHYSRGQLTGKTAAGFALYRAAGAGRARGSSARTGGTPFDPHHLEWLR